MPGSFSTAAGTNARFTNTGYSIKTLLFDNIYMDGLTLNASNGTQQIFSPFGTDITFKDIYYANSNISLCNNVMYESGSDLRRAVSFAMTGCKFYKCAPDSVCFFSTYYGDKNHKYLNYTNREAVRNEFTNNVFYNCASLGNNPYNNAVLQLRVPYPSYSYLLKGNSFIDTRNSYVYIPNNPGTDAYGQFINVAPINNGVGGDGKGLALYEMMEITGNRFIGRQTVLNSDLQSVVSTPNVNGNFVLSLNTVQAMSNPTTEISGAMGENPYQIINTGAYRPETWYLDYDMTELQTALAPVKGTVSTSQQLVTLVQSEGVLTGADFAPTGGQATLFTDADCKQTVDSIVLDKLTEGSHVYYLRLQKNGQIAQYTLLIHTATTERTYADGTLYRADIDGLPNGCDVYVKMRGALYHFVTGETAFGSIDRISTYTQSTTPRVLLPQGNYTAEELSSKNDILYLYDKGVTYDGAVSAKREKIKVACVGDSVTMGTGASNRALYAYPAQLQKLLGDQYVVTNFGRGGATASDTTQFAYRQQYNYDLSLQSNADVVIIAFGANDANNSYHSVALQTFKEELKDMARAYQAMDSHPIIYICSTPVIHSGWSESALATVRSLQKQAAEELGVGFIDVYALSRVWGTTDMYSDQCHPNDAGYAKLAADIYGAIDWTQTGAHLPETEAKIEFAPFACPHEQSDLIVDKAPDCAHTGNGHYECVLCGEILESNVSINATGSHILDTGVVTQAPTCVKTGVKTYTCTVCKTAIRTEDIPVTGVHSWNNGKVTIQPTVTREGVRTYTCTVCGATKTEKIAKLKKCTGDANCPGHGFTDMPAANNWAHASIDFAVENGLLTGISNTEFSPNGDMTRAMFVTVLGRLAGVSVNHKVTTRFKDVPTGKWYTGYVAWASKEGIVNGTSPSNFAPDTPITREQICKMMVEYCKYAGITLKATNSAVNFTDANQISRWAKDYVSTCQRAGLVNGSNNKFNPKSNATRAEVATILMNFDNNYHVLG